MIILTTDNYPGKEIKKVIGYVKGATVRSKHVGRDIGASFKTLVGGELKGYTDMQDESRKVALERMIKEAECKGANAILAVRFQSSSIMEGASEIMAYGTAVEVE